MPRRYELPRLVIPRPHFRLAAALRQTWNDGYTLAQFRGDVGAGLTVGLIALPLSMALAIASGVPPQHGLYTAIIAGALAALCGGSRVAVTGPTAAFVVVLVPIAARFGLCGLLLASLMAGVLLIIMGVARLGRLIQFIPHPVTTGFTAGIGLTIATLQTKDFLGLTLQGHPEGFLSKLAELTRGFHTLQWPDAAIGALTLALLIGWRRVNKSIPAPLIALTVAGLLAWLAPSAGFTVQTIQTRFEGIPQVPPTPVLPWLMPGPDGQPLQLSLDLFRQLLLPAVAIAMLGAIESLLCAVVADGMAGTKHDPDVELVGQGVANVVAPFFGGFAATGAIARTAANIRAGGRSPVAAIIHAVFVLAAVLLLAPLLKYLPMAGMAALLLVVAWNMSDARHFAHVLRVAPASDVLVLLTCFGLTVVFDMTIAVTVGVVLAAMLFMRRMADLTHTKLTAGEHLNLVAPLPPGVLLYEVGGPLFFGAAEKAMRAIEELPARPQAVILSMQNVPVMDVTGLVALESAIQDVQAAGATVLLVGVQEQPRKLLAKAGLDDEPGKLLYCDSVAEAEMFVRLMEPGGGAGAGSSQ